MLLAAHLAAGCHAAAPLDNTHSSAESLATAILDNLGRRDKAALQALALDDGEFREHVWPHLPASRPERNLPYSYVWGDLRQKSLMSLNRTVAELGERRLTLVAVRFNEVTPFAGYRIHREATLQVRDDAGVESEVRVCGSMIEKDGAWKVFSYVVE